MTAVNLHDPGPETGRRRAEPEPAEEYAGRTALTLGVEAARRAR